MRMRIESRVFWLPKDPGYADEYEDACAVDLERGRASIADGVSSAIFSGARARTLTAAVVADPPDVASPEFWDWLAERRREWSEAIDPSRLTFFQRGKLQQCGGAFATLLWLEWREIEGGIEWKCTALGDGGLLHVRDGQLLTAFPISAADELNADPLTVASVARSGDQHLEFRSAEGVAQPGDWLVLTTDASARLGAAVLRSRPAARLGRDLGMERRDIRRARAVLARDPSDPHRRYDPHDSASFGEYAEP